MNQIRHQGAPGTAALGILHLVFCLWPTAKSQMLSAKPRQRRSKRTACPLWHGLSLAFSARKGTRAFKFVKDLVLEVFGFPLTLPGTLAQHPAPWPGQLNSKRLLLDASFNRTIQNATRSLATATPLADLFFIPNISGPMQASPYNFRTIISVQRAEPA